MIEWLNQGGIYLVALGGILTALGVIYRALKGVRDALAKPAVEVRCDVERALEEHGAMNGRIEANSDALDAISERVEAHNDMMLAIVEATRNDLKAHIVALYQRCLDKAYITAMELDSLNRMADSYFRLGGNHYVHAIVRHANEDIEVRGELPQ